MIKNVTAKIFRKEKHNHLIISIICILFFTILTSLIYEKSVYADVDYDHIVGNVEFNIIAKDNNRDGFDVYFQILDVGMDKDDPSGPKSNLYIRIGQSLDNLEPELYLGYRIGDGQVYDKHTYTINNGNPAYHTFFTYETIKERATNVIELYGYRVYEYEPELFGFVYFREIGSSNYYDGLPGAGSAKVTLRVYEQIGVTLTGKAVDTDGNFVNVIEDVSDTVPVGSTATITRRENSDYSFLGWKVGRYSESYLGYNPTYSRTINEDTIVYAVYTPRYRITAISVDANGNELSTIPGLETKYSPFVNKGEYASVTRGSASGYSFNGWKSSANANTYISTQGTYGNNLNSNLTIYAEYEKNDGGGKIDTYLPGFNSTGYLNRNETVTYEKNDCSATAGCEIRFKHFLKRDSGAGAINFTVVRVTKNGDKSSSATTLKSSTFNGAKGIESNVLNDSVKLYPGQSVCETLTFDSFSDNNQSVAITSCVLVVGNAQQTTLLDIHVKNVSVTKYNSYQKTVYAKPTDTITFKATYEPMVQYVYGMKPAQMKITCLDNGSNKVVGPFNNSSSQTLFSFFNQYKGECSNDLKNWNNAFGIIKSNFSSAQSGDLNITNTIGRTEKIEPTNSYTVVSANVGKEIKETAKMNANLNTGANVKSSPTQVSFSNNNGVNLANVIIGDNSSDAKVIVPYNYDTSIIIDDDEEETVDSGGTIGGDFTVIIEDKTNELTTNNPNEKYHTRTDQAKTRFIVYTTPIDGEDSGIDEYTGTNLCSYFHNNRAAESCEEQSGNSGDSITIEDRYNTGRRYFEVPDIGAGMRICIAGAVYPARSGGDAETNPSGSNSWRISKSKCYSIGKKPTFQIWGGSFYSYGNVVSNTTTKRVLSDAMLNGNVLAISPWAEYSVVSNGSVTSLTSGAATGLLQNSGNIMAGSIERPNNNNYCQYRTLLSIANDAGNNGRIPSMCKNGKQITGNSGIVTDSLDIDAIISSLEVYQLRHADDNSPRKISIIIDNNNGNLDIGGTDIPLGTNIVWKRANDTIRIVGNILYDTTPYTDLNKIPKAIIYAKNIDIDCGVNQVDAILIAKDTINTCSGVSNDTQEAINLPIRSTLLKINGAVVADKLILNRTYGVGTGYSSAVPAEIINYDSTIVEWRRNMLNINGYNILSTVYQNELAPRY